MVVSSVLAAASAAVHFPSPLMQLQLLQMQIVDRGMNLGIFFIRGFRSAFAAEKGPRPWAERLHLDLGNYLPVSDQIGVGPSRWSRTSLRTR